MNWSRLGSRIIPHGRYTRGRGGAFYPVYDDQGYKTLSKRANELVHVLTNELVHVLTWENGMQEMRERGNPPKQRSR